MPEFDEVLVSVIITTCKRPLDLLQRAVKSALEQTHKNLEIIIVNDYPESSELVASIRQLLNSFKDQRLRYIVHKQNAGACKARNTGIMASSGSFIALLDDDDEWLPEKIELQLHGFKTSQTGMVYSPFYNITGSLPGKLTVRGTKSGDLAEKLLWTNCIGGSSMTLMRREVFDTCGLFDESFPSSQDYDMWIRIAQNYDIACINKPLTKRFLLEESISKDYFRKERGFERFLEKYADLYSQNPAALNYCLNRRVNKCIEQDHLSKAWELYQKAIRARLFSIYNLTEPLKGFIKYIIYRFVANIAPAGLIKKW